MSYTEDPIHSAAVLGNVKMVMRLLEEGESVDSEQGYTWKTPLHYACEEGHVDLVRQLLNYKASLLNRDKDGYYPLHHACERGHLSVVRVLVSEFNADLTKRDYYGRTALMLAASGGHNDLVLTLLRDYHCPATDRDRRGWALLHFACAGGSINIVQTLICEYKVDVNVRNNLKDTALHVAAEAGNFEIALLLVSKFGCDPNNAVSFSGYTLLHYACKMGDMKLVHALIHEFKADIYVCDEYENTPLHVAAKAGHYQLALTLVIEFGYDPNTVLSKGDTLLHYACKRGAMDTVRTLIRDYKADANVRNMHEDMPLHVAAETGHCNIALALVSEFGCDPNAVGNKGYTLLHYACKRGAMDIVQTLIRDCRADVDVRDENKDMPLHVAAKAGHYKIALALVSEFGSDPNALDNYPSFTLLHYACRSGDIDIVRTLIRDCKADVNVCNRYNKMPLHVAANAGHYEIALALVIDFGCDSNTVFGQGDTLLHYACKMGATNKVRILIHDCKADVNVCNKLKNTPLHVAAEAGHYKTALALVSEFGCDPNAAGSKLNTLLHYACKSGAIDVVRVLICDFKADVNVRDENKDTPLHVASRADQHEIVLALVKKYGCDPDARNNLGRTPLHVAAYSGHSRTVQILLNFTLPLLTDANGNTPLHLAAMSYRNIDCVKCLVHANAPLLLRNNSGKAPANIALESESGKFLTKYIKENLRQLQIDYNQVLNLAKKKYSGSHHITRVFVLGNPRAGKSSFVESLKREGFFQSFRKVSESSVPPHTAGIIPTVHMSKKHGRVLFYDFAGDKEYFSSHAAILENLAASKIGDNIFIVVVDLRKDTETIKTTLYYWFAFIQFQKFNDPSLIVVGSHVDLSTNHSEKSELFDEICSKIHTNFHRVKHFMLDCRKPRSSLIFRKQLLAWVRESQKYEISEEASLLLGLLEKDFSAVIACPVQTLVSHSRDCGMWLQVKSAKPLHQIILELQEVGVLLLLGDIYCGQVILNISKLTNEVHELLFSDSAVSNIKKAQGKHFDTAPLNLKVIPEALLAELLPPYITKECLIDLQYCQQIRHRDVGISEQTDSSSQPILFFPGLPDGGESQESWNKSDNKSFNFGWLAKCTDPHDYFPPRFLHILLLRLAYAFALSPEPIDPQTAHTSRCCTLLKKGVYWSMEKDVDCMVKLVELDKGVIVLSRSHPDVSEDCIGVLTKVVSCVMETKAKFCHSIRPQFFFLDSSDSLNDDHVFPVSRVERALSEGNRVAISKGNGKGTMELSKLQCMRKYTHWHTLFPIEYKEILHTLRVVVRKLHDLGMCLGARSEFLETLEVNFPSDVDQRRRELVKWWMSSSTGPPCWWKLAEALKDSEMSEYAAEIKKDHCVHIQLQEKLLGLATQALKPDEAFLCSLSGVVGSRWPSLAVSLSLSKDNIEELEGKVKLYSQQKLAFQMLKIWASRKGATYGQLCCKLNTTSIFQDST